MSKNFTNQINVMIESAYLAMKARRENEVKKIYENLTKNSSNDPVFANIFAQIALQNNQITQGIIWLKKSLEVKNDQPDALLNLGTAFSEINQFENALDCLGKSIKLDKANPLAYFNQGVVYRHLNQFDNALNSYKNALKINPEYVDALNGIGRIFHLNNEFNEAIKYYDKAIQFQPNYFEVIYNKSIALQELNRYDEALICFDSAIQLNPSYHKAYNGKGSSLFKLNRYDEALICFDSAIQLNPGFHEAYNNKGCTFCELKRYDEALICYDHAIKVKADDASGYWNKSLLKLLIGEYEEGWKLYEWRRQNEKYKSNYKFYLQPLWLGKESLQDKIILVEAEQGLGDIIQFCRYIPMLENIGAKVILETPKELISIISSLNGNFLIVEKNESINHFDYHIPIMSLPLALKTTIHNIPTSIPYLFSDKIKKEYWNKKLNKKTQPRIGLVWSGLNTHENDKNRSLLLKDLEPIIKLPFDFHSLQKEIRKNDQKTLFEFKQIHQHQDELIDFSDTAALIEEMDLIISVDTSVAHLAGALGKDVWILLPYHPDYRWMLDRNDSPWYPTCTLFRKSRIDDWAEVLFEIIFNLKNKFQLNTTVY